MPGSTKTEKILRTNLRQTEYRQNEPSKTRQILKRGQPKAFLQLPLRHHNETKDKKESRVAVHFTF